MHALILQPCSADGNQGIMALFLRGASSHSILQHTTTPPGTRPQCCLLHHVVLLCYLYIHIIHPVAPRSTGDNSELAAKFQVQASEDRNDKDKVRFGDAFRLRLMDGTSRWAAAQRLLRIEGSGRCEYAEAP